MADAAAVPVTKVRKLTVVKSNVPEEKTESILKHVYDAMDKFMLEKDIATHVKKKCDETLTGTWHCVAGRNFGCSITHDTKFVLFLQVDQMHLLIFKSLD